MLGLGRYGRGVAEELRREGNGVLGVDFDPETVRQLQHHGLPVCYGDIEDPEFIATLPLTRVKWIVSTAHERQINLALLQGLGHHGFAGRVAVTAHSHEDGEVLRRAGPTWCCSPLPMRRGRRLTGC